MKRPAAKRRPAARRLKAAKDAEEKEPKYKLRLVEQAENSMSREEFTEKVRAWARDLVPGHCTRISMSRNEKQPKAAKFYYRFSCMSCSECSWSGTALYDQGRMEIKSVDVAKHGSFDATYGGRGGLRVDQQNCVRKYMLQTKDFKLQHLMQKLRELGGQLPLESKVSKYAENLRQRDAEAWHATCVYLLTV